MLLSLLAPSSAAAATAPPDWPTVVRDGSWYLREAHSDGDATASWSFARETDLPFYGDWDGDGVATPGIYRDGRWYLSNDLSGGVDVEFHYGGRPDDFPLVGDWDGDGDDTVGVIRGGTWYLVDELRGGAADRTFTYGRVAPRGEDVPLVGDWDGDGADSVGIVRDGTWYLRDTTSAGPGDTVFVYGRVGPRGQDTAVAGDWDGDGVDTIGVVRGNSWYLRNANAGGAADVDFAYGRADDWKAVRGGFSDVTQQAEAEADLAPTAAIRTWFPDMPDKAIAVADCESGLNPRAVNPRGFHGLFQIAEEFHRSAFLRVTGQAWAEGIYTPYYNAQYARHLLDRVGGWSPWPVCGP